MRNYIIKRLLLIPITLLGILALNFVIVQFAPGGPIEHTLAKYRGFNVEKIFFVEFTDFIKIRFGPFQHVAYGGNVRAEQERRSFFS